MIAALESARAELAATLGESRVVAEPSACAVFSVDGKVPKYVVYPASAEQVAETLRWAVHHDLAVIPCRNRTKLSVGNAPRRYDVALSLKTMNNVWHYEPEDLTVSVDPGMRFVDFQRFVARHHLWLPIDPVGGDLASLGGILAANSTGALRLRYGAPRDMVLGMKIATPTDPGGKVIQTGGRVIKNVAGYDFSKLLIGSYGTLGVIVEASLKLYPMPIGRATFVFKIAALGTTLELRKRILNSPLQPLRTAFLNALAVARIRNTIAASISAPDVSAGELWLEAGGSSRVLERYARECESLGREARAIVERLENASAELLWTRIADPHAWLFESSESRPSTVTLKASLPIANVEEFVSRAEQEAEREHARLASFALIGVGVVRLCCLDEMPQDRTLALIRRLRRAVEDLRGVLVVEYCSPEIKAALDVWGRPGDDFEVMRKLKSAWDPKGLLAPGRLVGSI